VSFGHCSSSVAGSLNPQLLPSKSMLAALPRNWECANLHQSAYLDQNRYRAGYPRNHRKIPRREELYANTYIRPANWPFQNIELRKCYQLGWVGQVVCQAGVESALESALCVGRVEMHLFLASPACLWILCGASLARKAAGHLVLTKHCWVSFYRSLHLVMRRTLNTPLVLFSDLGAWFHNEIFRYLDCRANSLLWPFWPYSTPGACRTVPAVPDTHALQ